VSVRSTTRRRSEAVLAKAGRPPARISRGADDSSPARAGRYRSGRTAVGRENATKTRPTPAFVLARGSPLPGRVTPCVRQRTHLVLGLLSTGIAIAGIVVALAIKDRTVHLVADGILFFGIGVLIVAYVRLNRSQRPAKHQARASPLIELRQPGIVRCDA
jgi:hypothetical protein